MSPRVTSARRRAGSRPRFSAATTGAPRALGGTSSGTWRCGLLLLLALLGCGDGPSEAERTKLLTLWLEDSQGVQVTGDTLTEGDALVVRGRARLSTDAVVDTGDTWESSDQGVVEVAVASRARRATLVARRAGRATVTVRAGGLEASLTLTVVRPPVMYVELERGDGHLPVPSPDSLIVGTAMQYQGLAMGPEGRQYADAVITWTSSDPSVATVGSTGAVQARRLGRATITAESEGQRAQVMVVVRPPLAARIAFLYAPDTLVARRTDSVRVVLLDSAGRPMGVPVQVRPSNDRAAYDPVARMVTGTELTGTTELVASGDGLSARHGLVILPVPVARVDVLPGTLTMKQATSLRLRVAVLDLDDRRTARAVTFASGDPALATIDRYGNVLAIAAGRTTVRVSAENVTTTLPIDVVPSSAFRIEVRWPPQADATAVYTTDVAVQVMQHAVLGDLPDARLTLPADACGPDTPAGEIAIDDLLVLARVGDIDGPGGTAAMAGPCVIRDDGTTIVGEMVIDVADIGPLMGRGTHLLPALVEHELGHVLGIGTTWGRAGASLVVEGGGRSRFMGSRARRVAAFWGKEDAGGGVTLGDADGTGDGHWSESVFTTELMTPFLDEIRNDLSLLTIEALGDLGYVTGAAAAQMFGGDAFVSGSVAASRAPLTSLAPRGDALPLRERTLAPRWRMDGSGRVRRIAP